MATLNRNGLKTPLYGHQDIAVDHIVTEFSAGATRATAIMATGTGKTHVALNAVHETAPDGRALVLVPTLDLLEQTAGVWRSEGRQGRYVGICSPDEVRGRSMTALFTLVGTPEELAETAADTDGPLNVFCTYQSLGKVVEAHAEHYLPAWDMIVADEAHHTVGSIEKSWATVHDNRAVPARHRLYLTATYRKFDRDAALLHGVPTVEIASMDDQSLFGPIVYRLSMAEAIQQGLLADYRVAVITISDRQLRKVLKGRLSSYTAEALRAAASQIALLTAQMRYDLLRTLSFHPCIAAAESCAEALPETAAHIPGYDTSRLQVSTVNSRQAPFVRHQNYQAFRSIPLTAPTDQPPQRAVLTNCRCCAEGIDIPAIDSLLFAHPKTSSIDIVQCIGRTLRQTPGEGKISTIILPVYAAPGQKISDATRRTKFNLIYQVLIELSVYDEHLFHRVEFFNADYEAVEPQIAARPERVDEILAVLGLNHVEAPNEVWELGFEEAQRYYDEHGDLNVASRYLSKGRFHTGWWLGQQRSLNCNRMLLPERFKRLSALGMTWEHPPHSIEYKLDIARDYTTRHGHLAPRTHEHHAGIALGRHVADWRREVRHRTLPDCYRRALNDIYPWWDARWKQDWKRTYAAALTAARRGELAFPDLSPDSDDTPLTNWLDQQIDKLGRLTSIQHNLLGALPISHPLALLLRPPRGRNELAFARGLRAARTFWRQNQHLDVPRDHISYQDSGPIRLGNWIHERRHNPAQLTDEQIEALQALDMRWI
ncbi:DEAD/DEAH box helicase [Streptomyces endophyticus]|uniref:Helicase associated domain protein n=1 Tax=Streptomyces endophyticus TaxID=714166 RepID=A0ABU6FFD3_9ACTN|nr:Helicase associated domain protein [Streptomyces endophyticus]MEB8342559.1 Helicase associated domain protein [Streptomyces endophyticus]